MKNNAPPNRASTHFVFNYLSASAKSSGAEDREKIIQTRDDIKKLQEFFKTAATNHGHPANFISSVTPRALETARILNDRLTPRAKDAPRREPTLLSAFFGYDPKPLPAQMAFDPAARHDAIVLKKIFATQNMHDRINFLPRLNVNGRLVFLADLQADIKSMIAEFEAGSSPDPDKIRRTAVTLSKSSITCRMDDAFMTDTVLFFNKLAIRTGHHLRTTIPNNDGCVFIVKKKPPTPGP